MFFLLNLILRLTSKPIRNYQSQILMKFYSRVDLCKNNVDAYIDFYRSRFTLKGKNNNSNNANIIV